jgi:hypothetical protein
MFAASVLIHLIRSALWGDDDSEEEEFEEEYEGSFIDDVEGVGNGPDSDLDVAPVPLFDMEDEDDEEIPRRTPRIP